MSQVFLAVERSCCGSEAMWEQHQVLAQHLCFLSSRSHSINPETPVGSTPIIGLISRFLLDNKVRYRIRAFFSTID